MRETKNATDIRRKLGDNKQLINVEYWSRRYFPTFRISIQINSEYTNSVAIYGRQQLSQFGLEKFEQLQSVLKTQFGFRFSDQNEDGVCD
jgi:hypothetical protein